jgi:hypothetical protein
MVGGGSALADHPESADPSGDLAADARGRALRFGGGNASRTDFGRILARIALHLNAAWRREQLQP